MAPALPLIAVAATVIGTGVTAYSMIQQGQAAKAAGSYQAQVAENNAVIARRNASLSARNANLSEQSARQAEGEGVAATEQQARRTRGLIGAQRAATAASGLDVNSGSALDLQNSTADLGEESVNNIRDTAARRAAGFRIQGLNYDQEEANYLSGANNEQASAALSLQRGRDAVASSYLQAGGAVLSGIGGSARQYSDMTRTGVPFGTSASNTVQVAA